MSRRKFSLVTVNTITDVSLHFEPQFKRPITQSFTPALQAFSQRVYSAKRVKNYWPYTAPLGMYKKRIVFKSPCCLKVLNVVNYMPLFSTDTEQQKMRFCLNYIKVYEFLINDSNI